MSRLSQNGSDVLGGARLPLLKALGCETHSRKGIRHASQDASRPQPNAMQWGHDVLAGESSSNGLVAELTHLKPMIEIPISLGLW